MDAVDIDAKNICHPQRKKIYSKACSGASIYFVALDGNVKRRKEAALLFLVPPAQAIMWRPLPFDAPI